MGDKVLVNLATGLEDAERVLVAFLVATAALGQGREVVIWATKEAVRLGLPGEAKGVACTGCPPLERLFVQFKEGGGQLWLPDLRQRPRARRCREGGQLEDRGSYALVGMGR